MFRKRKKEDLFALDGMELRRGDETKYSLMARLTGNQIGNFLAFSIYELLSDPVVIPGQHIDALTVLPEADEEVKELGKRLAVIAEHIHVVTQEDQIFLIWMTCHKTLDRIEDRVGVFGRYVDVADEKHGVTIWEVRSFAKGILVDINNLFHIICIIYLYL